MNVRLHRARLTMQKLSHWSHTNSPHLVHTAITHPTDSSMVDVESKNGTWRARVTSVSTQAQEQMCCGELHTVGATSRIVLCGHGYVTSTWYVRIYFICMTPVAWRNAHQGTE